MAILRYFRDPSILENNIVQTVASAAGTLSAIIFVLPGLVMIGWWKGFPFWTTFAICVIGGMLGVMFTVPLRRALVTDSDLPYPEGVAAAEVLKVGAGSRARARRRTRKGLRAIAGRHRSSPPGSPCSRQTKSSARGRGGFRAGAGATGIRGGLSFALMGVGHLVGLSVGMAMFVGLVISLGVLLPILTASDLPAPATSRDVGSEHVWARGPLLRRRRDRGRRDLDPAQDLGPIVRGIRAARSSARGARASGEHASTLAERDLPIGIVGGSIAGPR